MTADPGLLSDAKIHWGLLTLVLTLFTALVGGFVIGFQLAGAEVIVYFLKPTVIILIAIITFLSSKSPTKNYKGLILAGLGFSLLGDILLMLPVDLFIFGLIAFAVTQIIYTIAFSSVKGFDTSWRRGLPFLLVGIVMIAYLWQDVNDMRLPVLLYAIVILTMAWQALGQWQQTGETRAFFAFIGALLFVTSDALLAINRFSAPIPASSLFVLGSYYIAQWFIGVSAGADHL
jgi:uncharacterized membrane protein YhhN